MYTVISLTDIRGETKISGRAGVGVLGGSGGFLHTLGTLASLVSSSLAPVHLHTVVVICSIRLLY